MSKAFTKETDDESADGPLGQRASASLPPGMANYITPGGAQKLRDTLERLVQIERPALAESSAENGDASRQRRKLNHRIGELEQILQSVVVIMPPVSREDREEIVFGAAVTVREVRTGEESRYQIVGVDEVGLGDDRVSWRSPIARALINRRVGERVHFEFPAGAEELEVIAVYYE